MSRFKTNIPVEVAATISQLPPRSYVEAVQMSKDRKSVEIVWGCDDLKTGYTFAVDAPLVTLPELRAKADAARTARAQEISGQAKPETVANPLVGNDKVSVDKARRGGRKAATA